MWLCTAYITTATMPASDTPTDTASAAFPRNFTVHFEASLMAAHTTRTTTDTIHTIRLSLTKQLSPSSSEYPLSVCPSIILIARTPHAMTRHTSANSFIFPRYDANIHAAIMAPPTPAYARFALDMITAPVPVSTAMTAVIRITMLSFPSELIYAPAAIGTSTHRKLANMSILPNVDMYTFLMLCISPSLSPRKSYPMNWHMPTIPTNEPASMNMTTTYRLILQYLAIHTYRKKASSTN